MHKRPLKRSFSGLAERAKSKRLELGLSQQVAATRAGMSMNRLRDLERYGLATMDTVTKLARALSVDVDYLTGRKAGSQ
jgi:transcriptional regulator with XRE-family HTH domain